ncbi:hypothetical protein BVX97_03335 [bacterium E08(2017)]|nr:hypothetical protein BVX97_03335 [bacterium E08(2017)]
MGVIGFTQEHYLDRPAIMEPEATKTKASCNGKYTDLLKTITVMHDFTLVGSFNERGYREDDTYHTHRNLPSGYWVYVFPNWYIFENESKP